MSISFCIVGFPIFTIWFYYKLFFYIRFYKYYFVDII